MTAMGDSKDLGVTAQSEPKRADFILMRGRSWLVTVGIAGIVILVALYVWHNRAIDPRFALKRETRPFPKHPEFVSAAWVITNVDDKSLIVYRVVYNGEHDAHPAN